MDTLNRISELLANQGKSQKDLTDVLGLHRNAYTEWKRGKSVSYNKYIYQIADFLGVSVDYLRGDSDDVDTSAAGDTDETTKNIIDICGKLSAVDKAKLLVYADGLLNK